MIFNQIFDAINIGLVIIDNDLKVYKWNRWMQVHSGIDAEKIIGAHIFETFPGLNTPKFLRSCKSVFSFGNFCFFSQKLHHYLFPFKSTGIFASKFKHMQQNCAMGPLRDENHVIRHLFIYVQDVTEVAVYEQKLLDLNMKDDLTAAYNRRFLEMKLNEEVNRYRRYRRDFSIIMFDIDYFKGINDRYGHQCGDFILKSVSSRISSKIRNVDYLARYGGDEFCCLLPETDIDSASIVAERFRTAIMELENNFDGSILKITISLGVSELREGIDTPEILLKKADQALYKAKREGRNRVVAIT